MIGDARSFGYRLQAQSALCQLKLERNMSVVSGFESVRDAQDPVVFAHVVRYEVGREENAEPFVDEVMRAFDGMQGELPNAIGSLLLTRPEDGEVLQIFLFANEEDATDAEGFFHSLPAPDTGAREVMTGRRPNALGRPVWHAWQGRWNLRPDASSSRSAT